MMNTPRFPYEFQHPLRTQYEWTILRRKIWTWRILSAVLLIATIIEAVYR